MGRDVVVGPREVRLREREDLVESEDVVSGIMGSDAAEEGIDVCGSVKNFTPREALARDNVGGYGAERFWDIGVRARPVFVAVRVRLTVPFPDVVATFE